MNPLATPRLLGALFLLVLLPTEASCITQRKTRTSELRRTRRSSRPMGSAALVAPPRPRLCTPPHARYPSRWAPPCKCSMSSRAKDETSGGDQGVGGGKRTNRWSSSPGEDNSGEVGGDRSTPVPGTEMSGTVERLFAQPAAPRRRELSEGLGKGAPSPKQRLRLEQETLELRWRMAAQEDRSICCRECAGEGICECRFCDGTGLFKVGKDLMLHPTTGRPPPCPVCRNTGEETCRRCKGAGRIAVWMFRNNQLDR